MLELSSGHHVSLGSIEVEAVSGNPSPEPQRREQHLKDLPSRRVPDALGEAVTELLIVEEQAELVRRTSSP